MRTEAKQAGRVLALVGAAGVCAAVGASARATDPWAPPAGFYDTVAGTGAALKGALFTRMSTLHTQRTYGNFRDSAALHDRDPNNPSNIRLVYNGASVPATWDNGGTWNREHVWPDSLQPDEANNSSTGNLGDPHALRPCDPNINTARGNMPFGFEATMGGHGPVGGHYFPGDAHKGDIARCLMYSETRYGPVSGLALVDSFPFGSQMADLSALVAWHFIDPPDEFERRRNHVIFSSAENPLFFTNNRNAYVDRPEYVWSVYRVDPNDSLLYVGAGPGVDGSSQTSVDLGDVLVGAPAPGAQSVTLHRAGEDGTYFEVTAQSGATSTVEGRFNAFPINDTGIDSRVMSVGLGASALAAPGVAMGQVVIDNLDVTEEFGDDRGADDGDDVIFVEATVLARAQGSFDGAADVDLIQVDFGSILRGSGDAMAALSVHNLEGAPGFTAALDAVLDAGASTGDLGVITTSFVEAEGVEPGSPATVVFTMDDAAAGDFEAHYTIRVYDDRTLAGFAPGAPLVVQLVGAVFGCPGDVNGDNVVDTADLGLVIGAFGGGAGPADLNGDGVVDTADLGLVLAEFGGGCGG